MPRKTVDRIQEKPRDKRKGKWKETRLDKENKILQYDDYLVRRMASDKARHRKC